MLSILLIGVGLSMDAFAVSVTSGLTVKGFGPRQAGLLGLYFGGFQFLMPLLGYLLGSTVSGLVSEYAPYISFFLLAFVGVKMLVEAIKGGDKAVCTRLRHSQLLVMAIATSLDALAVGVSFAFMKDVTLLPSCLVIGCTTFVLCFIGGLVGGKIPGISCRTSGILGGVVLCGIGVKLLIEGLI
jgi:putative Mn2+ efflux pump MntP